MNESETAEFREMLHVLRRSLNDEERLGSAGTRTVTLDQQAVGRLSRMDALQNQAMARANQVRREQRLRAVTAALKRIDEGEFGYCETCGEDIAINRMKTNPTVTLCISCARG